MSLDLFDIAIHEVSHEHWFSCRASESSFAGDSGAIEIWLIDWLIMSVENCSKSKCLWTFYSSQEPAEVYALDAC